MSKSGQIIDVEETNIIQKAQKTFTCIKNKMDELKAFVLNHPFTDEKEDILFFKET